MKREIILKCKSLNKENYPYQLIIYKYNDENIHVIRTCLTKSSTILPYCSFFRKYGELYYIRFDMFFKREELKSIFNTFIKAEPLMGHCTYWIGDI